MGKKNLFGPVPEAVTRDSTNIGDKSAPFCSASHHFCSSPSGSLFGRKNPLARTPPHGLAHRHHHRHHHTTAISTAAGSPMSPPVAEAVARPPPEHPAPFDPSAKPSSSDSLRLRTRGAASKCNATSTTTPSARPPVDPYPWLLRTSPIGEAAKALAGLLLLAVLAAPVGLQMILCVSWEALNARLHAALHYVAPAIPRALATSVAPRLRAAALRTRLVRLPEDAFFLPLLAWLGLALPAFFFHELFHANALARQGLGLEWGRVLLYNIVRLGPMYAFFMYVYVLCHKEAHRNGLLFERPAGAPLTCVFNHWVGLFHGVLPGVFTVSHVNNHHRYDNSARDVYSTAFRRRDRFMSFVRYIPEWFLYASNVSSCLAFLGEGRTREATRVALGTVGYLTFVVACAFVHLKFTLITLVYPFFEANLLLSVVNYVWHAFIDEEKPTDDYVNSTTIVEGLNFTLAEEYHVVHHQYAGVHWTRHKDLYLRHIEKYKRHPPSAFYKVNIFELFYFIVTGDCDKLVQLYYEPLRPEGWTDEALAQLLKKRLQCHGLELANQVGRTYKGHLGEI